MKQELEGTNPGEVTAEQILKKQYKEVHKIGFDGKSLAKLSKELGSDKFSIQSNLCKGEPDFLAWNNVQDYKFIEVKTNSDSISKSQMQWMSVFGKEHPLEVWWYDNEKKEIENKIVQSFLMNRIPKAIKKGLNFEDYSKFSFNITSSESVEVAGFIKN